MPINEAMISRLVLFTFITLFSPFSGAAVETLVTPIVWQATSEHAKFVLPMRLREENRRAVDHYIQALRRTQDLHRLVPINDFRGLSFASPAPQVLSYNSRPKVLLVANTLSDHLENSKRIVDFTRNFAGRGFDVFLLPLGASLRLNAKERINFHEHLAAVFDVLVPMGGDDVDPKHYDETNIHSHAEQLNFTRDQLEIELIQNFSRFGGKHIFAVCRGAQLTSVALNYHLIQDLRAITKTHLDHGRGHEHSVQILSTTNNLLKNILPGETSAVVNSFHHQAVRFVPGGPLEVAAVSEDGIIEALESKDGRFLLMQFHPEKSDSTGLGQKIFDGWAKLARQTSANNSLRCEQLLKLTPPDKI